MEKISAMIKENPMRLIFTILGILHVILSAILIGLMYIPTRCGNSHSPCYNLNEPKWLSWTGWSDCSASFGHTWKTRFRFCLNTDEICFGDWVSYADCYSPFPDCKAHQGDSSSTGGVFTLHKSIPVEVYCDFSNSSQPWLIVLRRTSVQQKFDLGWKQYENGFGNSLGNYWLGLKYLFKLTNIASMKVRFDLETFDDTKKYAEYGIFRIGSGDSNYSLTIGDYSGNAGDALTDHNSQAFKTKENDDCSKKQGNGGFWYPKGCGKVNLMGKYYESKTEGADTIHWMDKKALKKVEMKIAYKNYV